MVIIILKKMGFEDNKILESINIAMEVSFTLKKQEKECYKSVFFQLEKLMLSIKNLIKQTTLQKEVVFGIDSCCASIARVNNLFKIDKIKLKNKFDFEFIPLLQELFAKVYFFSTKDLKKYYEKDINELFGNEYIEVSELNKSYKYDLSIAVRGYNKLEYTKICIENLLKNLPENLSYELILINHGSSDGTKEYFETIKADKQIDIEVNGGGLGIISRIIEGRYFMQISNDVIITQNVIQNLYKCISSDENIAWVVPSTSNVSNLQSISTEYRGMEELIEFANNNNKLDRYRWEQRVRLVNPIEILRSNDFVKSRYFGYFYENSDMFPDDRLSLLFRRYGKKLILAKDSYCHHFGSITHGSINNERYYKARKSFKNFFGIDPWTKGFCYDLGLFDESFNIIEKNEIHILGINCGLGSNSLKIKEIIKERLKIDNIYLTNATNEIEFVRDLRSISDKVLEFTVLEEICSRIEKYDYLIIEEDLYKSMEDDKYYLKLFELIKSEGYLILYIEESENVHNIVKINNPGRNYIVKKRNDNEGSWLIIQKNREVYLIE